MDSRLNENWIDNILPVRVWVINPSDTEKFEHELHELGYVWSIGDTYMIRDGVISSGSKTFIINFEEKVFGTFRMYKTDKLNENDEEPIMLQYHLDKDKIFIYLKYGYYRPTYKPKKILRESNDYYLDEYLPFVVWCDTAEKANQFEEFMHNKGWTWPKNQMWISRNMVNEPQTFVYFHFKDKTFNSYSKKDKYNNIKTLSYPDDKSHITLYLEHGKLKPSYEPKKTDRLNEEFHDDYKYNSISISFKTNEELKFLYDYILEKFNLSIFEDINNIKFNIEHHGSVYIRIVKFGSSYKYGYGTVNEYENNTINNGYSEERLFTFEEVKDGLIENILKYGKSVVSAKHMYQPKKFLRESVYQRYHEFIIEINNLDDLVEIKNNFPSYRSLININKLSIYPNWVFVNSEEEELCIWSYKPEQEKIDQYIDRKRNSGVYYRIFNINRINLVKRFTEEGVIKPDYEPKKLLRESIEDVKGNHYYRIKNEEEMIRDYGEDWRNNHEDTWWNSPGMDYFIGMHLYHVDDEFIESEKGIHRGKEFIKVTDNLNSYWSILIKHLIKITLRPSYLPKKINRLNEKYYEKKEDLLKLDNVPSLLIGDEIIFNIRRNAFEDLVSNYDNVDIKFQDFYERHKHETFNVIRKYYDDTKDVWWTQLVNDKIFSWFLDMSLSKKVPSYAPRVINKLNEGLEYPYDEIVIMVKNETDPIKYINFFNSLNIDFRKDLFYDEDVFPNCYFLGIKDYYKRNYLNLIKLTDELVTDDKLKQFIYDDPKVNSRIFTVDDFNIIGNILLKGYDILKPTYEPKKISKK